MIEREGLYTLEELLKPRQIFVVNTEDTEYLENEMNRFFDSVIDVLGYDNKQKEELVERKSFVLHSSDDQAAPLPTDSRITLLIARNSIVASVLETRDESRYVKVAPASYLNPEMIRGIGERQK